MSRTLGQPSWPVKVPKPKGPPFEQTFLKLTSQSIQNHKSSELSELFITPNPTDFQNQHEYIEALILHSIVSLNLSLCNYRLSNITLPIKYRKAIVQNLAAIDFSKNSFRSLPKFIRECGSLEKLFCSYNKIESISMNNLSQNLSILDLSNNCLGNCLFLPQQVEKFRLEPEVLVSEQENSYLRNLARLPNLRVLNVSYNNLIEICHPSIDFNAICPNLLYLHINNNNLIRINKLPNNIIQVNANNNRIQTLDDINFSELKALKQLDLEKNLIKKIPNNIRSVISNLKILNLANNPLTINYQGKGLRHQLQKSQWLQRPKLPELHQHRNNSIRNGDERPPVPPKITNISTPSNISVSISTNSTSSISASGPSRFYNNVNPANNLQKKLPNQVSSPNLPGNLQAAGQTILPVSDVSMADLTEEINKKIRFNKSQPNVKQGVPEASYL